VLERASRDRTRWLADHPLAPLTVAVNVSARQLVSPDFGATVANVVDGRQARPRRLRDRLLLTELPPPAARAHRQDRPEDQSFVADIGGDPCGGSIVAAVTNLAHVLGLVVTAEGVETQAQRDAVGTIGCESSQGFYYARPMSASAISAHLATRPDGALHLPLRADEMVG
jgi:EAL domain-containing protein (putative c-di-GMP-specific phosphodiesterase class I)